ncbi:hypothetical protein ACOME3_000298 [Neoechinorhynchus agilis]
MWTTFKEACSRSKEILSGHCSESTIHDFFDTLDHKNIFSLLRSPLADVERSDRDYQALLKANTNKVSLCDQMEPQLFSRTFINEALAFVQLYSMNEMDALRLVYSAYCIQHHYPEMSRGLVAVLLYYDSKVQLLCLLLNLMEIKTMENVRDRRLNSLLDDSAADVCGHLLKIRHR